MRATIYPGRYYFWNLRQCAFAAQRYPGLPATQEGLAMLQEYWKASGEESPPKNATGDMSWAQAAFRDLSRTMKYEQVPA